MDKKIFIVWILMLFLLTGCFSTGRKDGPPGYPVDVSNIHDAIPRNEPISKYGNPDYYTVFGKRYYPMKTRRYYEQVGVASWYGKKFHAQRTSSGEPYNMLAMTAAHKTLPLPSYVEVTNLKNHRKIIVKVNDRGPFESNRIIDLSYVAAKKLDMLGRGTADVKIRTITPQQYYAERSTPRRSSYPSPIQPKLDSGTLYVQAGAFRSRINAEKLQTRLAAAFSSPVKISHQPSNKLYRVQIGPVKDVAAVNNISQQLRSMGLK